MSGGPAQEGANLRVKFSFESVGKAVKGLYFWSVQIAYSGSISRKNPSPKVKTSLDDFTEPLRLYQLFGGGVGD